MNLPGIHLALNKGDDADLDLLESKLIEAQNKYHRDKPKRFIPLVFFLLLGGLLGEKVPSTINLLNHSMYGRKDLDNIMLQKLGNYTLDSIISDETLIVAYDYNS